MEQKRGFGRYNGCLPSPPDARDYRITRLVPKAPYLPAEFVLLRPARIKDQGDIGSCVGQALATSREIGEALQKHICEFSPGYIYANRTGHTHFGEGMIPREAIATLKEYGVPRLDLFPYNDLYPKLKDKLGKVKSDCDTDALPHRITAYANLFSAQDIKVALTGVGAVPVTFDLYDSFDRISADGIVPVPNMAKEYWLGNHMMIIIGWKKIGTVEHWIVLNSWGQWWGDNGLCYIPVKEYGFTEAWSLTDEILPAREETVKIIKFSTVPELASNVALDGVTFELPVGIRMKSDRIMVPLRFVSESLGCYVKWDSADKRITISSQVNGKPVEIVMTVGQRSFSVNGQKQEMDVEPFVVEPGFTLVPLRFVTENLDCRVDWNGDIREATITRK